MLGVDNIEGTFLEEKIRSILSSETAGVLYKLREGNQTQNKNLKLFSDSYLNYVKKVCGEYIHFFGYSIFDNIENDVAYFQYDSVSENDKENFNGYLQINQEMKEWYKNDKQEIEKRTLDVYKPGEDFIKIKY